MVIRFQNLIMFISGLNTLSLQLFGSVDLVKGTFLFQGAVSGSVQASDRLMKELRDIYRSQSYKTGKARWVSAASLVLMLFLIFM